MENKIVYKRFIYIACIFGMLFLMLIPPFQSPDEGSHFEKAYVLSRGKIFPEVKNGKVGFYLPTELIDYIKIQEKSVGNFDAKQTYADTIAEDKKVGIDTQEEFTQFSTMSTNPIGHIIPCIGILLGKIVSIIAGRDPSIVMLLYFARLVSLISYVIGVFWAIYITPVFKRAFCFVGLLPMALSMGSMVSNDGLLITVSFLFSALCFRLIFDENYVMKTIHIILFALFAYIFYTLKIVYLPMIILLIFIPKEKYKNQMKAKQIATMCCIVLGLIVAFKIPTFFIEKVNESTNGMVKEQLVFVIKNPIRYLIILYNNIKEGRDYYISSSIGVFGHVDTFLYSVLIYPYLMLLVLVGILDANIQSIKVTWRQRCAVFLSVAAGVFGVFLAMYIMWTSVIPGGGVGVNRIDGVQGRYLIPFMPIMILCVSGFSFIKTDKQKRIANIILNHSVLASIIILSCAQIIILLRFWV